MIPTTLTSERVEVDGRTAIPYQWNGESVLIYDDANTVIQVIDLLSSGVSDEEKIEAFLPLFFVDPNEAFLACDYDIQEFVKLRDSALWDLCGLDMTGEKPKETPLWDLQEDAALIRISFRQAYGIEWNEIRGNIPFSEFISLIAGCPFETPLGKAIYYRNPNTKPKQTKYNAEQIKDWQKLHNAFALKAHDEVNHMAAQNNAMNDFGLALKRAVSYG